MLFRTEIQLAESKQKIQAEDRIFSIGSCFATEMASIFASGQLQTVNNPFGTIFHPVAVNNALKRIYEGREYTEDDFIYHQENISVWIVIRALMIDIFIKVLTELTNR